MRLNLSPKLDCIGTKNRLVNTHECAVDHQPINVHASVSKGIVIRDINTRPAPFNLLFVPVLVCGPELQLTAQPKLVAVKE